MSSGPVASLDSTSVVVVGAWNPAIIQPPWLFQSKVVETIPDEITVNVNPRTRQFRYKLGAFIWTVDDNRLRIHSAELEDCGIFAARVLALLPHTPVDAVGTNFVYKCPASQWPKEFVPALGDIDLESATEKLKGFDQFTWTGLRNIDAGTFQLSVSQKTSAEIVISCNTHRNVETAAKGAEFAGCWKRDYDVFRETLSSVFGVSTDA